MGILDYILLFLSVLIGGGLAFYLRRNERNLVQLLLSFSGAYILGITFLHLVPETYDGTANIGFYVLIGFFIQLLLDQLSKGVEHGHIHTVSNTNTAAAIAIMVGLCLHAFIEGLPLDIIEHHHHGHDHGHHHDHHHEGGFNHLLYAIVLHKIPAAFALGVLLLLSKFKDSTVILYLVIFGAMSPMAAFLGGFLFDQGILSNQMISILMAIVIGSFLHIATTILFETDTNHKIQINKLTAILVGLGIAVLTVSL